MKTKTIVAVLLIVGIIFLAGCSGNASQYDYQPTYQNQPPQVGGGCGVTAPAEDSGLAGASTVESL